MRKQQRTILGNLSLLCCAVALTATGCVPKSSGAPGSAAADASGIPVGGNLLKNATFENGATLPWTTSFTPPANGSFVVTDGAACVTINEGGSNNWDAQIRHREMVVQEGHTYNVTFKIWADKPTMVRPKVGMAGPPYREYWNQTVKVTTTPQEVRGGFVMQSADDPTVEFAFHMGGAMMRETPAPVTICIDDIYMNDPDFVPPKGEAKIEVSPVRVNQLGYLPGAKKVASVVNSNQQPLAWSLIREGKTVAEGKTEVFGKDADSGDHLHLVDFTSFKETGAGYTLKVGDDESPVFAIKNDIYSSLKKDALHYFYHNRSGIEIAMPYAVEEKWARPAGHLGDKSIPCAPDAGCKYKLDVSKGWYDAGDHGKYVVNGGISVWTVMNQYERFKLQGGVDAFGDGKLNIPEGGNKVPDILDEARWEMEFMLGMQVPAGQPHAGMAHHKMHDVAWTALGLAPHEAEKVMKRHLRPVSTAATLNLAATAAQAARVFKPFDAAFATRCLKAAETAWAAAKKEPTIFADPKDGSSGGGPYDDKIVDDDFYWAAAELFVTTKKGQYGTEVRKSKHFKNFQTLSGSFPTSMTWGDTAALGSLSLALVPGALAAGERKAMRDRVVAAADSYLAVIDQQGYRTPFAASGNEYPWGSNSFVINNAIILAYAYDFTKKDKYLEGVVHSLDYLLGRNAMGQSYVSGYGSNPLRHPHHRFWSEQVDGRFPPAAPGALSGGPNSGLQDPYVQAAGLKGCAPQKCFLDHIEAWSVNEITINWNAPLAWVTGWIDQNASKAKAK